MPMMMFRTKTRITGCCSLLFLLIAAGCGKTRPTVTLELFQVTLGPGESILYDRSFADLSRDSSDPDTVARGLLPPGCDPVILHSTSWRWEKNGSLVLTYLAFSESPECRAAAPSRLKWREIVPPQSTDPKRSRPTEIREQDVLAHGIRHITFLVRYSRDRRIADALSPGSLAFFQSMCAQLAGRFNAAREFEDCVGTGNKQ